MLTWERKKNEKHEAYMTNDFYSASRAAMVKILNGVHARSQ